MRVSSFAFARFAVNEMNRQTLNLNNLQMQISSGKKLQRPSDDPAQMAAAESLDASLHRMDQYEKSTAQMNRQLAQEETILDNMTDNLQRLKELTIAADSGIVNNESRHAYLAEAKEIYEQILDNANTRTPDGEYLFSGSKSRTTPFSKETAGVIYNGDQTQNYVKISDSRKVTGADNGYEVFMKIPEGNGHFKAESQAGNTGQGAISIGSFTNYTGNAGNDTFEIEFSSPTSYSVVNKSTGAVEVSNATYVAGQEFSFSGLDVSIDGTPAAGDKFTVRPAATQSVFAVMENLLDTLSLNPAVAATKTQYHSHLDSILSDLDASMGHINAKRSDIGARMGYIENTEFENESISLVLQETRSKIEDADLTEAISNLQFQQTTLEALRATYASVSKNSLFNHL